MKMELQVETAQLVKVERGSRQEASRIYVWLKTPTLENRRERIVAFREFLTPYMREGSKLRWSRTAGCSCGCSPGFIVDGVGFRVESRLADLHITLSSKN